MKLTHHIPKSIALRAEEAVSKEEEAVSLEEEVAVFSQERGVVSSEDIADTLFADR